METGHQYAVQHLVTVSGDCSPVCCSTFGDWKRRLNISISSHSFCFFCTDQLHVSCIFYICMLVVLVFTFLLLNNFFLNFSEMIRKGLLQGLQQQRKSLKIQLSFSFEFCLTEGIYFVQIF